VIELPVSGGELGAMAGTLTAMAAGPIEPRDEELLLGTIANELVRFDAYGEPTLAKLFNNVLAAYNATAYSRLLLLAREAGLEPAKLSRVIKLSSGGSWVADGFLELLDDLLVKDVDLLRGALGSLPTIGLNGEQDFPGVLAEARGLFAPEG
jgi:3-hydroxyisobutyrate dehydrogenase-like beta-hydroxyacid dehydrogenase